MKTHIRDIRYYNNAGISIPVCQPVVQDKAFHFGPPGTAPTCLHCLRAYPRRYPWAGKGYLQGR